MKKQIKYNTEAREEILKGVDKLANAVKATLGPKGRLVAIKQPWGAPRITKDGVTVAKAINLEDEVQDLGAQMVKEAASKTAEIAGDGTTTATVLTQAIAIEGNKLLVAGANPMDLKRGIDKAVLKVNEYIKKVSKDISNDDEIAQVGAISANGDLEIGAMIAAAIKRVGKDGVINLEEGKNLTDETEIVEGMQFDKGYTSPYFITNSNKQRVELENPFILIFEQKLRNLQPLIPLFTKIMELNRALLIIAEDIEIDPLAALVQNKLQSRFKIAVVKAPGYEDTRLNLLHDIAISTKSQLISNDLGLQLEDLRLEVLGSARTVVITRDTTTIVDGGGDKGEIEARCDQIRAEIENCTYKNEKTLLEQRLAKLCNGVAILKIGGATEVTVKERKDRVEDALNATRAAISQGIVPGGGVTLLYASRELKKMKGANEDEQAGINILRKALMAPLIQIIDNAGLSGEVVSNKLLKQTNVNFGFDAADMKYVDMIKAGIIDPTKVVRTALEDAVAIATSIITTEVVITDLPKKEDDKAPNVMKG